MMWIHHCAESFVHAVKNYGISPHRILGITVFYWPQQSCGQGNIFTPVCHSVHRGGFCLSACWDTTTPLGPDPPEQTPPPRADLPGTRPPQADPPGADTPWTRYAPDQTPIPPGKQTPAYGLRAAGTHPTGMHSCTILCLQLHLKPTLFVEFSARD